MRRVVELALGVCLGIGIGDLLVSQIGTGSWQVGLVVLMAMSAAILLGGGPVFVGEAATSGVLVATVAGGAHGSRFVDALVGGIVGLFAVVVLPQNPLRVARREAAPFFAELSAALDDVADALEQRDVAGGRQALARTRRAEPAIVAWRASLALGNETARSVAAATGARARRLDEYAGAAVQLELAVRNARVLARSAVRAVETTTEIPAGLVAAVRRLAEAVREVEPALELRDRSAPIESALTATTLATRAVAARSGARVRARRRARSGRSRPTCSERSVSTETSPSSTSAAPPNAATLSSKRRPASSVVPGAAVLLVHQRAREHEVGGRAVARDRRVVDDGDPQQRLHVDVVRVRLERVPEEDHEVDAPFGDRGADLLVAAERAAEEAVHLQAELVGEQRAGGAGRVQLVRARGCRGCSGPSRAGCSSGCRARSGRCACGGGRGGGGVWSHTADAVALRVVERLRRRPRRRSARRRSRPRPLRPARSSRPGGRRRRSSARRCSRSRRS